MKGFALNRRNEEQADFCVCVCVNDVFVREGKQVVISAQAVAGGSKLSEQEVCVV